MVYSLPGSIIPHWGWYTRLGRWCKVPLTGNTGYFTGNGMGGYNTSGHQQCVFASKITPQQLLRLWQPLSAGNITSQLSLKVPCGPILVADIGNGPTWLNPEEQSHCVGPFGYLVSLLHTVVPFSPLAGQSSMPSFMMFKINMIQRTPHICNIKLRCWYHTSHSL